MQIMPDLRPVFFVIGLMVSALGVLMLVPVGVDYLYKDNSWQAFLISAILTTLIGGIMVFAARTEDRNLRARGAFVLTTFSWIALAFFCRCAALSLAYRGRVD